MRSDRSDQQQTRRQGEESEGTEDAENIEKGRLGFEERQKRATVDTERRREGKKQRMRKILKRKLWVSEATRNERK